MEQVYPDYRIKIKHLRAVDGTWNTAEGTVFNIINFNDDNEGTFIGE